MDHPVNNRIQSKLLPEIIKNRKHSDIHEASGSFLCCDRCIQRIKFVRNGSSTPRGKSMPA